jgi:RND superfamily putative drug exporter
VAAALTLGPAVISVAIRFGKTLEPKRAQRIRGWRKIGALVVRWPGPILVITIGVALVGLLTLPGYRTNYNDRNYLPALSARGPARQRGLRRRGSALLAGADES